LTDLPSLFQIRIPALTYSTYLLQKKKKREKVLIVTSSTAGRGKRVLYFKFSTLTFTLDKTVITMALDLRNQNHTEYLIGRIE
jgi:hypothetical protein